METEMATNCSTQRTSRSPETKGHSVHLPPPVACHCSTVTKEALHGHSVHTESTRTTVSLRLVPLHTTQETFQVPVC